MMADGGLIPDGFASQAAAEGGFVHLPFEAGSADPQDLSYGDLPGITYDPNQDWREAQKAALQRMFGEFAPEDEEATGG